MLPYEAPVPDWVTPVVPVAPVPEVEDPYLDEDDEYCESTRFEVVVWLSLELAADEFTSLSCLFWSSAVLSWDSSSWILALAVFSFRSSLDPL